MITATYDARTGTRPLLRVPCRTVGLAAIGACLLIIAQAGAQSPTDERSIRDARTRSNQAIAAHDTMALAESWLPDFWLVSSTNAQTAGRDAARSRFAQQFAVRRDLIYVRTPDSVVVNSAWGQAAEYGTWTGRWTQADGVTRVGGRYFAKWRKVQGRWMLLAETFVQTSCQGSSYCDTVP